MSEERGKKHPKPHETVREIRNGSIRNPTDAVHAATVLGWYRLRWTIETWFRTLKTGTRIKDRRLDSADDLRKCLAFDAVTAVHVADTPSSPGSAPRPPRPRRSRRRTWTCFTLCFAGPPGRRQDARRQDIRAVVIDLGRLVGSHPNPRQPLPGARKVWQGLERLNWAIQDDASRREKTGIGSPIQVWEVDSRGVRVSCDKWNTPGFFRNAGATDVAFCLKSESPNATDDQGRTPMHHAALHGEPVVIAVLAEGGADPDALDDSGRTPLHLVAVLGDAPEAVSALVTAGANLDALDGKGRTPLEFAERFGETPSIVAALREARTMSIPAPGEDAAASCENWNTPGFFRKAGPEDLTRCLETRDPNARNENGRTPMHYAAQGTSPAMVTALAKAGANPNTPDERGGWTPLHLAAWFCETPAVVAALLTAGADPAVTDGEGKTPWDYAQSNIALKDTPVYWRLDEERSN